MHSPATWGITQRAQILFASRRARSKVYLSQRAQRAQRTQITLRRRRANQWNLSLVFVSIWARRGVRGAVIPLAVNSLLVVCVPARLFCNSLLPKRLIVMRASRVPPLEQDLVGLKWRIYQYKPLLLETRPPLKTKIKCTVQRSRGLHCLFWLQGCPGFQGLGR